MDRSCFLPDTFVQIAWDSTSLSALKQCPRYYQYSIIEGWEPKQDSIHLRFGQEYHRALQNYDESRAADIPHDEAVFDVIKALMERTSDFHPSDDTKAGKYKSREALIRTVIWYLEQFKDDPAKTLVLEDGQPAVELSFSFPLDWEPQVATKSTESLSPYVLCGHFDRVVTYQDQTFIMDRKTTTSSPGEYYFNQYEPNNQMSLYAFAAQVLYNVPVKGIIIDVAQLLVDGSRFVRGFTYRTPDQTQEWLFDLRYWLIMAESYAVEGYWPQNDTACDKFGGCRYRSICSKSPSARQNFLAGDFVQLEEKDRWNPLVPR